MDIQELITSILSESNVPVIYGWYDKELNKAHITFLEIDTEETDYQDDVPTSIEHLIQVDIWTRDGQEAQKLKKEVKEKLKNSGFRFQNGQDKFEMDTKLWHIPQRFLIIENI
ncbi:hypothetical protein [Clostridium sp. Marseille-Q2269]|uniref:hypothetical protein n=1 Tax=Clostridium sp. Marseille-Q2269 TaxID=2942205 RepID=UPI002072A64A|nr:hypothetical protein [Clostridium sp. Marseille-Q2269]